MIKLIKRTTDNKYLKSVETETWVDDIKDAFEMTYLECEAAKTALNGVFLPEQLKEIINPQKGKPMSDEERAQLSAMKPRKNNLPKQAMLMNTRVSKKEDYLKSLDISKFFKK
jgi:hypothetical protein